VDVCRDADLLPASALAARFEEVQTTRLVVMVDHLRKSRLRKSVPSKSPLLNSHKGSKALRFPVVR
jgi:hypothetical protein